MAGKGAPPEYLFKPGQSGNPGGRPKYLLTRDKFKILVDKIGSMKKDELMTFMADPNTTVMELAVGNIFAQAVKAGDYGRLSFLLDRTIGRSPDQDPIINKLKEDLSQMSDAELLEATRETIKQVGPAHE